MSEETKDQPRSHVMALRKGRVSRLRLPISPGVTMIEVRTRTEYINGRPVVRYFLPAGSTISNEPKPST